MGFLDEFLDWTHQGLLQSEEAQSYLLGRGSSPDQWARHRLGFVLGDYEVDSTRDPGHKPTVCSDRDSIYKCDSCRFRRWSSTWESPEEGAPKIQHCGRRIVGHVVFPLTSYSGSSVGFQTRSIVEKAYDSFSLTRRSEGYFFGTSVSVHNIWSSQEAWLVEGPGDHLVVERLISNNVLALTTSSPGLLQIKFLKRFARRIVLCLDADAAGRKSVRDFCKKHDVDFDIVDLKYPCLEPKDKDPGDLWRRVGDSTFIRLMNQARNQ